MTELAKQRTRRLQMYLCVHVVVLAVASMVALSHQVTGVELSIFRLVNNLPAGLYKLFLVLTQLGSAWVLFGVTLVLIGLKKGRLALRLFGTGSAAYVLTEIMKHVIARPRPGLLLDKVYVRDFLLQDNGFPSGHTAVVTAMGLVLITAIPPKHRWLCWLAIAIVAFSRIYLGVHAPLDVVGGYAIAVIVVCSSQLIHGKLKTVLKITKLKLQG